MSRWDDRFIGLAEHIAGWSKDPSTKVGSVIVRPDKTIASVGFNGFPRGVRDDERLTDRDEKYPIIVHAEANAIVHAREPLHGHSIYVWPMPPCAPCAALIIQAGIKNVYAPLPDIRWEDSCYRGMKILWEAGVESRWLIGGNSWIQPDPFLKPARKEEKQDGYSSLRSIP